MAVIQLRAASDPRNMPWPCERGHGRSGTFSYERVPIQWYSASDA